MAKPDVSAAPNWMADWKAISWKVVNEKVFRLQARIAKAVRENRWMKVKALQRILVRSSFAKALAVRRVTTNKGKHTPGVDGIVWKTPRQKISAALSLSTRGYKPLPLRRAYVPKKNGKRRPLGIPTMKDRAMQALLKLALEPVAETLADPNSYGFRRRRSTADALGQCYTCLAKRNSPAWIWEADIEACFDNISHEWMLKNIPMDKGVLRKWLKAGFVEDEVFNPTEEGTPQGGLISPVLANMVLDGLEATARGSVPRNFPGSNIRTKVNVIRYADDFIITAHSKDVLEEKVIPAVISFLKVRGLNISQEKSKITHISDGFDFLGAHIRKYGWGKFLMMPSKENVLAFKERLRDFIRNSRGWKTEHFIHQLNSKIRGWANYFRSISAAETFAKLDDEIQTMLWQWSRKRHNNKGAGWVVKRYFRTHFGSWVFFAPIRGKDGRPSRLNLVKPSCINIRRHAKVRAEANVFDPAHDAYFADRRRDQRRARQADFHRHREWQRAGRDKEQAA